MNYTLIDSGDGQKLERFGQYTLIRPSGQAIWHPACKEKWASADLTFTRDPNGRWTKNKATPESWIVSHEGVRFKISPTEFGHLGLFPEHGTIWSKMRPLISPKMRILNLFAYSGGVTLAAAQEGAAVCHLDASPGMVEWARENALINQLEKAPIRWIVDDVMKFMKREVKRKSYYDGIVLDPPTFGRGTKGEVFKIEKDLTLLLELCAATLSSSPRFIILSCHTTTISPIVLSNVISQIFGKDGISTQEMVLTPEQGPLLPSGCYAMKVYGSHS